MNGTVKRQLTAEDLAMILQWALALLLAPFVLLPLFPREPVDFPVRLAVVLGGLLFTALMTAIYVIARRRSSRAAAMVVNITAACDVLLVFTALLIWPRFIPDLFGVFTIIVIVVASRFGYREVAVAAVGLAALYAMTIVVRTGLDEPTRTVVADTAIRIIFLLVVAVVTANISQRERRERNESGVLSEVAVAIGSTLDTGELIAKVVEGLSEAAGFSRCSAFMFSRDRCWAVPTETTETDPAERERFFRLRIDLRVRNVASTVLETGEMLTFREAEKEPLLDSTWVSEFKVGSLLAMPLSVRKEAVGLVFVEKRGRFLEREIRLCRTILSQASSGLENSLRYAEELQRRAQSDALYRTSRELSSSLQLDRVLENACRLAMDVIGARSSSAFVLEDGSGMLVPRASLDRHGNRSESFPPDSGLPVERFEEAFALAQRPPAVAVREPADSTLVPRFLQEEGSLLFAPFFSRGKVAGLVCVGDEPEREYSDMEATQLAALAGETALAVMNATLHEKIKSDAMQMASLVQLANAIGSTADLAAVMHIALETVRHLFDCSAGLMYRLDEERDELLYADSFGYSEEVVARIDSEPRPRAGECWSVSEGTLICVDDLSRTKVACRTLEKIGAGSTICVGMQVEGRTVGVLHIRSEHPGAFGEQDQQLAMAIADQVAIAIQRALLFEEIKRLAATDPLTGVYNVRRLDSVMKEEGSRARRYERPLSFLMVDVDNLKAYNDTLGHQMGDVVLSQVASIIDSGTRDVDKVFRYGGDEFSVVLPETEAAEALLVADKLRRAVEGFHFPGEDRVGGSLTVSIGVASLPDDAPNEEALIREADMALYRAKQRGRNSVERAG